MGSVGQLAVGIRELLEEEARAEEPAPDVDWEHLQRPGARPAYLREDEVRARLAFHPKDYEPTPAAEALTRNNMPLLAYIAGKPAAFTSKDHNFRPGETVEKQIVVINNSRLPVTAECEWSPGLPRALAGTAKIALPTGEQTRIPLRFDLPADLAPGRYELQAVVRFSTGETQKDGFAIGVLPARPAAAAIAGKIALYDPKGDTAKLLRLLGVAAQSVDARADLASYDVLVVGKGALTLPGAAPDIARVRDGLKVIVFEQTAEVLEKRFGFRVAEYGLRWVFRRIPDHPLLAGLADEQLRDWRGASTILPAHLTYERPAQFNYVPTVEWAGIPVTRVWREGNRGNVASALIEKPARGDFLPILDGGYNLQYSPLMEYREGSGVVLFCQMDVSGRTEPDPAAETLARNVVRYVADWKPGVRRTAVYAGDPAGKSYLQSAGIAAADYSGGPLGADQVLVLGPQAKAPPVSGHVLAIGSSGANTVEREYISTYFPPFGAASPFAGVSPGEVLIREPRKLPLIGDSVLAVEGSVVFSQLVPWQFAYTADKINLKRTFRRIAVLTARLLGNLGVGGETQLLARFAKPAGDEEKRWLDGLYLDTPEEWDDPYRFFRW